MQFVLSQFDYPHRDNEVVSAPDRSIVGPAVGGVRARGKPLAHSDQDEIVMSMRRITRRPACLTLGGRVRRFACESLRENGHAKRIVIVNPERPSAVQ
jgi:hypothetical protein